MNLVIHDLSEKEWSGISAGYEGWDVISDNGEISPCTGCFCCWRKTPGQCVIKDGYEHIGARIHHAEEVTVISKYTYGGFSPFVKNVFDRCIGYVLPQFEVINGETHHKRRYDEDKAFTFIFYGHDLSPEEKESAWRYVEAVCANIRGHVKELEFWERGEEPEAPERAVKAEPGKTVILNGSMRNVKGNSAKFARMLQTSLNTDAELVDLRDHLDDMTGLVHRLEDASTLVLCMPLYVDGLPAQVIKLLETFRKEYRGGAARIYLLANMGLYESKQLRNLFGAVRQWCMKMDFRYMGGLGISAGELLGTLVDSRGFDKNFNKKVTQGTARLAEAINRGEAVEDIFAEPHHFPRWLYILIANTNWNRLAKRAGISKKDLYRRL
ncbi:MAG: hypothetical protein K6D56_02485 [Clostridia bacterium]|nr:hypothetical protein [Clostridia bacterium]